VPYLILAIVASACGPRDGEIRRQRLQAERRSLEATLDRLEDRLLVSQGRVRFWNEMRSRHESVTAIACASLESHAEEMASHRLPAEEGAPRRTRVASVSSATVSATHEPAVTAPRSHD
jgi:hypothetical protein